MIAGNANVNRCLNHDHMIKLTTLFQNHVQVQCCDNSLPMFFFSRKILGKIF